MAATPQIKTPSRNVTAARPPPPYCEVTYINGRTFVASVSDPVTSTYEAANPSPEEQCMGLQGAPEGMILVQIVATGNVVKACGTIDTQGGLRTNTDGETVLQRGKTTTTAGTTTKAGGDTVIQTTAKQLPAAVIT